MRKGHTNRTLKGLLAAALVAAASAGAHAQTASTAYRGAQRDPFAKFKPSVKRKQTKAAPAAVPPIQARIDNYKAQKLAAMNLQQAAPKPTTALLLSEVQVKGIFRTPRGYAAMVEATPIKLSYVIYPGERFYDAQLVAIEEGRLVFRREKQWSDGRREMSVETKPLRKVAPADQLAAAAAKLKDEKPAKPAAADQAEMDAVKREKPGGNN